MRRLLVALLLACAPAFAANEGGPPPACYGSVPFVCKAQHNWATHLFRDYSRIADMTTDVCITVPAHVHFSGLLNLYHRNTAFYPDGRSGPVGWAVRIGYRYASTLAGLGTRPQWADPGTWRTTGVQWIPGAKSSGNIVNRDAHYAEANLVGYVFLTTPGCYRFEVWGNSHSDLAPNTDGLIAVNRDADGPWNDTYNALVTTVTPAN